MSWKDKAREILKTDAERSEVERKAQAQEQQRIAELMRNQFKQYVEDLREAERMLTGRANSSMQGEFLTLHSRSGQHSLGIQFVSTTSTIRIYKDSNVVDEISYDMGTKNVKSTANLNMAVTNIQQYFGSKYVLDFMQHFAEKK